jgi:hypothetical protein
LQPKIYDLKETVISAKSLESKRRRNLLLFKEEFIGNTANAQECEILNTKDITFNYDSDDDTIKAYALKPILIENRALGYKITYYLDKFEYYKEQEATFFCGNLIFNEDFNIDKTQKETYERKREHAYLGSRMHFFRVLWSGKLKSSEFIIKNPRFDILTLEDVVIENKNSKFLKYNKNLLIEYNNRKSTIEFLEEYVYFDESGFFNPGLNWRGEMALKRIADWLPYEYSTEK